MSPEKCSPEVILNPIGRPFYRLECDRLVEAQRYEEVTRFPNIIQVVQVGPDKIVEKPYERVKEVVKPISSE